MSLMVVKFLGDQWTHLCYWRKSQSHLRHQFKVVHAFIRSDHPSIWDVQYTSCRLDKEIFEYIRVYSRYFKEYSENMSNISSS
jgi:hypothetical protein